MKRRIADLMTRVVESITPRMTVHEVAARMRDRDLGALPVCVGGIVIGIVTDRDLALRVLAEGRDPSTTRVEDVMSRGVVCCDGDALLGDAVLSMTERKIRRLPVVSSEGRLVGMLTLGRLAGTDPAAAGAILKEVIHSKVEDRA